MVNKVYHLLENTVLLWTSGTGWFYHFTGTIVIQSVNQSINLFVHKALQENTKCTTVVSTWTRRTRPALIDDENKQNKAERFCRAVFYTKFVKTKYSSHLCFQIWLVLPLHCGAGVYQQLYQPFHCHARRIFNPLSYSTDGSPHCRPRRITSCLSRFPVSVSTLSSTPPSTASSSRASDACCPRRCRKLPLSSEVDFNDICWHGHRRRSVVMWGESGSVRSVSSGDSTASGCNHLYRSAAMLILVLVLVLACPVLVNITAVLWFFSTIPVPDSL